jgi:sugar O-acyltransferase (sialic acid O-acetyltransferase NeuD family)
MYLFGASGHGKVIKDILDASGVEVRAFVDDNKAVNENYGFAVLHNADGLSPMIVSVGVNAVRKRIVERLHSGNPGISFGIAIHPSAVVSPSAKLGEGTVIMAGAVVNADAVIGKHCIINTGASVDHECVVGDYCHIAPHATLCGQVHIGEGTLVGVGACVIPCINIGTWCTVGAGAAVINEIFDNMTVVGVPAREVRAIKRPLQGGVSYYDLICYADREAASYAA